MVLCIYLNEIQPKNPHTKNVFKELENNNNLGIPLGLYYQRNISKPLGNIEKISYQLIDHNYFIKNVRLFFISIKG